MMKPSGLIYARLGIAMALAGSSIVIGKIAIASFPIFLISTLRFALAFLFLLPLMIKEKPDFTTLRRKDWLLLFLQAVAGNFLFSIFLLYGLRWTSAVASGIITSTTPAVIGLIALLFLKERVSWRSQFGILLAVGGVLMINILDALSHENTGANPLLGNLLVFGAVLGESLWTILGKMGTGKVKPLTTASLMCLFGLILFLPFGLNEARTFPFQTIPLLDWWPILFYALVTVGAYTLWYSAIGSVPANIAGVFGGMMPIAALTGSFLLLGEIPRWFHLVGGLCVLLAIVLIAFGSPHSHKSN
jgi:drug/metabolite transporter (DMT)-like permease